MNIVLLSVGLITTFEHHKSITCWILWFMALQAYIKYEFYTALLNFFWGQP